MLGLKINNEALDLAPGTMVELERTSPFFNLEDLAGEWSLPITLPYTPKNARLLGLANHYYTKRKKTIIPAAAYDGNNFIYNGELIVESAGLNLNNVTKSSISGYFLTGVSSFFQQVKKKKLQQLILGGERSFVWTNNNPTSPFRGFWQQIHESLPGKMDYSFAPIINESWAGSGEGDLPSYINALDVQGNLDYENNYNTLAPQVSLKYLLTQIFEEHGWSLDHSQMDDSTWETIFIPSFYAIAWQKVIVTEEAPYWSYAPLNEMKINLQNHVPPEMLITTFIMALRNRFNWGFDWDATKKVCKMFPLRNLALGVKKDWTKYVAAVLSSDFSEDLKIFNFRNEIDSSDQLASSPDLTKVKQDDPVFEQADLPEANEASFNRVRYCWKENQYFQCQYNEEDFVYEWILYANNIYDYAPPDGNEDIATPASTMPVYRRMYRDAGETQYFALFPYCEQEGNWEGKIGEFIPWGLRLLFHRGMVAEANPLGFPGPKKYPYLTSLCFTPTQEEPDLPWSNVYQHSYDGIDKGIISFWFKESLPYLSQSDVITTQLHIPREELLNFKWSDVILIRNIPYIVQKMNEIVPYNGSLKAELRRIG